MWTHQTTEEYSFSFSFLEDFGIGVSSLRSLMARSVEQLWRSLRWLSNQSINQSAIKFYLLLNVLIGYWWGLLKPLYSRQIWNDRTRSTKRNICIKVIACCYFIASVYTQCSHRIIMQVKGVDKVSSLLAESSVDTEQHRTQKRSKEVKAPNNICIFHIIARWRYTYRLHQ